MKVKPLFLSFFFSIGLITVLFSSLSAPLSVAQLDNSTSLYQSTARELDTSLGLKNISGSRVISSNVGSHHSLAIGVNGELHISFNNEQANMLYYAVFDGEKWVTQSVDTGTNIYRNSIDLGPTENSLPQIAYSKDGKIIYAHLVNNQWISETIAAEPNIHRQVALSVDGKELPHIVFSTDWQTHGGYWMGNIDYAYFDDTDWVSTTVVTKGEEVRAPLALDINSSDIPQLLYKKRAYGGHFGVHWLSLDPVSQTTQLESGWYNTYPPGGAIFVDANDEVYWTYRWHGQKVGGTNLMTETLATGGAIGNSDITVDENGRVFVVYQFENVLRVAVKSPIDDWIQKNIVTVDQWNDSDVSIVTEQNNIHITYHDITTKSLIHIVIPKTFFLGEVVDILVDDFEPQPYQGEDDFYYNRLDGDRGSLADTTLDWGDGRVTATIASGAWGGMWTSLNHINIEEIPLNFSAILPQEIVAPYQSPIIGVNVRILDGTPGRNFKVELKNGNSLLWQDIIPLTGGEQTLQFSVPPLTNVRNLNWVLDQASPGDYVVLDELSLTATTLITHTPERAFVWSYGMLLNNWDSETGLVRDQGRFPSGDFEGIQSTGGLAAATVIAEQLGVVTHADAVTIVTKISDTLLLDVPRYHGLWPHFVKVLTPTNTITISNKTEWSTVDTAIAAISLLEAQTALDLDTSGTEAMLHGIDWDDLVMKTGISHGYKYTGEVLTSTWDVFGGESWLVGLIYTMVTGEVAPLEHPRPPTANGSGFIDELAWLFVPPPCSFDVWGAHWPSYQIQATYTQTEYYPTNYPNSCFDQLGLFGLSAAEVPMPSQVITPLIYQPFGVGGQFSLPNDGSLLLGAPVVVPHYAPMIAPLRPTESIQMWDWLIEPGPFSPVNNVESLMFVSHADSCDVNETRWNHLKGSWNLTLQTLGWGRYLAVNRGYEYALWGAVENNSLLHEGYQLLIEPCFLYLPITIKD